MDVMVKVMLKVERWWCASCLGVCLLTAAGGVTASPPASSVASVGLPLVTIGNDLHVEYFEVPGVGLALVGPGGGTSVWYRPGAILSCGADSPLTAVHGLWTLSGTGAALLATLSATGAVSGSSVGHPFGPADVSTLCMTDAPPGPLPSTPVTVSLVAAL